jgi:hypothetical protein
MGTGHPNSGDSLSDEARCTAHSKQTGERCRKRRRPGLTVCFYHGGKAPRADVVVRETLAIRGMEALRDPVRPVVDPLTDLLEVAARSRRLMEVMEDQVSALKAMRYGGQSGEQTRAELAAYERSLDRCARILADIVKLDLEARLVRVSEVQAAHVITAFHAALEAAGVERGSAPWTRGLSAGGKSLRKVTAPDNAS